MESLSLAASMGVVALAVVGVVRGLDVRLVLLAAAGLLGGIAGDLRPILRKFLETFSDEKFVVPLCSAMGFAYTLKHTGCDAQLVGLLVAPIRRVRFLLVPGVVLAGFVVNIPVVSQSSTAVCLGTVAVPLMRSAGFSPVVIGSSLLFGASVGGELLNPSAVELSAVKKETGTDTRTLCWEYIPPLLFPLLTVALAVFWWRASRASRVGDDAGSSHPTRVVTDAARPARANLFQAFVPLVPLVLLFISGPPLDWLHIPQDWLAVKSEKLPKPDDVVGSRLIGVAMLVGVLAAAFAAPRKAGGCAKAFFDGAGYAFTHIISLIVVAQCFGTAVEKAGLTKLLAGLVEEFPRALAPLAAAVPCLFALVCGSGIASSQTLYPLFHPSAVAVGANPDEVGALVSVGSAIGRTLSPVSAVALMCGTLAGVKSADLCKRLAVPLLLGLAVAVLMSAGGEWFRAAYLFFTVPHGSVALTTEQLAWMPLYYLVTVAVELPVLWFALSRRHGRRAKVFAGFWLTACTYPVLWLVLPPLFNNFNFYLLVGETLVPLMECALFWAVFVRGTPPNRHATARDTAAIVVANLASFGFGLLLQVLV